jgi:hypothetical protein
MAFGGMLMALSVSDKKKIKFIVFCLTEPARILGFF